MSTQFYYRQLFFSFSSIVLLLFLITCPNTLLLHAQPLVTISDMTERLALNTSGLYWEDTKGTTSFDEIVRQNAHFVPIQQRIVTLPSSASAHWLRFRLVSLSDRNFTLFLGSSGIDSATLFVIVPNGRVQTHLSGEHTALSRRDFPLKQNILALTLEKNVVTTVYLRIRSVSGEAIETALLSPHEAEQRIRGIWLIAGLMIGVLIFAMLYNVVLLATTRDPLYIWYVIYVGCFALLVVITNFTVFENWFPNIVGIGYYARIPSALLLAIASTMFSRDFLLLKIHSPLLYRILTATVMLRLCLFILFLLGFLVQAHQGQTLLNILSIPLSIAIIVPAWKRRQTLSRAYALTYMLYSVITVLLLLLRMQNADPADNGIGYFLSLGSVGFAGCAEAILFSLFLAARINELRERYLREQEQRLRAEQENENERLRTLDALLSAQRAELAALRYQINPHFLFNTLGSLRALAGEDAKRTQTMIGKLSEYLRYTLYPEQGAERSQIHHEEDFGMVSLREEITMIQNYFDIEHIRFEEALQVEYNIESEALSFAVPGFLLQPLAENALKFGMQTSKKPIRITIAAYCERKNEIETILHIRITNTGTLLPNEEKPSPEEYPRSNGIGLKNVRERLRRTFDDLASLELHEENGTVTATIIIKQEQH